MAARGVDLDREMLSRWSGNCADTIHADAYHRKAREFMQWECRDEAAAVAFPGQA